MSAVLSMSAVNRSTELFDLERPDLVRSSAAHGEASSISNQCSSISAQCSKSIGAGKATEEPVSTDVGDDTEAQESQSDSACSDVEVEVDSPEDRESGDFVYSLVVMLQMRKAVGLRFAPSARYSTQPAEKRGALSVSGGLKHRKMTSAERTVPAALRASSDDEKVARAARSILNKLTVEKFETLYEQLAICGLQTPDHVRMLMREIFEKATTQHHFIAMYADLCVRLEMDPRIMAAVEVEGNEESFRRLLLNQCQAAFEQLLEPWAGGEGSEDDEQRAMLRKKRAMGNVKLVGQLMVYGMLSPRLLCSCAEELLRGHTACPEALESLATLLTVCGSTFDLSSFKFMPKLEAVFGKIRELTVDKKIPTRSRFLLRDLLDLRKAGWSEQSRPNVQPSGPMTIGEVHQQAYNEERAAAVRPSASGRSCGKNVAQSRGTGSIDVLKRILEPSVKQPQEKACKAEKEKACKAEKAVKLENLERMERVKNAETAADKAKQEHAKVEKEEADKAEKARTEREKQEREEKQRKDLLEMLEKLGQEKAKDEELPLSMSQETTLEQALLRLEKLKAWQEEEDLFDAAAFHRVLAQTMRMLATDRDVAAAVDAIREQSVPEWQHSKEFTDIISRAAEESRGPARRSALAFAAALVSMEPATFSQEECMAGASVFFQEVYEDLCNEVPHLEAIARAEIVPALRSVLPAAEFVACLPLALQE